MLRRACRAPLGAVRIWASREHSKSNVQSAAFTLLARSEAADGSGSRAGAQEASSWRTGAGLLAASAAAAGLAAGSRSECEASSNTPRPKDEQSGGVNLIIPETRKMMFFKYERSLRQRSPPDKARVSARSGAATCQSQFLLPAAPVNSWTIHFPDTAQIFDYFSSVERQGNTFMRPVDFMRAVIPVFQPFGEMNQESGPVAQYSFCQLRAGTQTHGRTFYATLFYAHDSPRHSRTDAESSNRRAHHSKARHRCGMGTCRERAGRPSRRVMCAALQPTSAYDRRAL